MQLRYNPYQIFDYSKSAPGLYARQKWLGEAGSSNWQRDFDEAVAELYAGQLPDGSWNQSELDTIQRLFGLHLTVREPGPEINAALDWLTKKTVPSYHDQTSDKLDLTDERLIGLPFIPSRKDMFVIPATLFLASIFGRSHDSELVATYQHLGKLGLKGGGLWLDKASTSNVLRAMVVHPEYSKEPVTGAAVEFLTKHQRPSGEWESPIPFYQTVNALAHLELMQADAQLDKAFKRLMRTQKADGTWGDAQREWNTFLVIHALRNKGML